MQNSYFLENLCSFGLTRQESQIYVSLLTHGEMTGYEVSKDTGISRSNAYASLNGLVEKGCAYLKESEVTKYIPVEIKTFTQNCLNDLQKKAKLLEDNAPQKISTTEGYITIVGAKNISNKIREMLEKTQLRLYVMATSDILSEYESELQSLVESGKKIVLISDDFELSGAIFYKTEVSKDQIRLITDSNFVLTGEYSGSEHDTCLYSGQKNLVEVLKEALKNKIEILNNRK